MSLPSKEFVEAHAFILEKIMPDPLLTSTLQREEICKFIVDYYDSNKIVQLSPYWMKEIFPLLSKDKVIQVMAAKLS